MENIESKLDNLKSTEKLVLAKQGSRRLSLPGRFTTFLNNDTRKGIRHHMEDETNKYPEKSSSSSPKVKNNIIVCLLQNCVKEKGHTSDSKYHELDLPVKASCVDYQTNKEECSYRPLPPNISDISDLESEDEEEMSKRIEMLADAIKLPNIEAEGGRKVKPNEESCLYSRRRKSSSKIRFISETIPTPNIVCVTDTAGGATMEDMITGSV